MGMRRLRLIAVLSTTLALVATGITATAAVAAPAYCDTRVNNTTAKLLECVDLAGVREHQAALQAIADDNGDTRVSGSPGYDLSVDYVVDRLTDAGWQTTVQPFQFQTFVSLAPPVLIRTAPQPITPIPTTILSYSGSGDVTAAVSRPADTGSGTEGCEASDFAGFPAGNIALIQRGGCTFAIKATNADAAGAVA
ncbi:MAG: PA domain-containing protein, partial [Mycetocola sp.]